MTQYCENCRFFSDPIQTDDGLTKGTCYRYPPQVTFEDGIDYYFSPEVYGHNWCGEWRPILENGNISAYYETDE